MTLYEIDSRIRAAIDAGFTVDEDTGEVTGMEELEALESERNDKIEAICCVIKEMDAATKAFKDEIAAMKERSEKIGKKRERLANYLKESLAGDNFATARCAVSYRKSTSVEITDDDLLPDEFKVPKITFTPDKVGIKTAIKGGVDVPGAAIKETVNMIVK